MSYYAPSPSSRSSSPVNDFDSSPPSSPSSTPYDIVTVEPTTFNHPFAGSTHAGRKFRQYEKKPMIATSFDASCSGMTRYRSLESREPEKPLEILPGDDDDFDFDVGDTSIDTEVPPDTAPFESFIMRPQVARAKWEELITGIVDNPSQMNEIDLTGTFIGYVPRSIVDLNNVVVLPQSPPTAVAIATAARKFARAATSPLEFTGSRLERNIGRTGSLDRWKSTSFSASKMPLQLKLTLVRCGIRALPLELFRLEFLTSLDLRGNLLAFLPPQINQLQNLKELVVSTNRLRYLPSEILGMNLTNVQIHPNHFIPKPLSSTSRLGPITRVAVSGIRLRSSVVPSLQEHCLRVLLQDYSDGLTRMPNLKAYYEVPLPSHWRVSDTTLDILGACYPAAVPKSAVHKKPRLDPQVFARDEAEEIPAGLSVCPSPVHLPDGRPIFVHHVEEIFTWETRIAGKDLFGMPVPILWRGCSRGCLSFLHEEEEAEVDGGEMSEGDSEEGVKLVDLCGGQTLSFSDDEGMEF